MQERLNQSRCQGGSRRCGWVASGGACGRGIVVAEVERRRREDRGTEGAEAVEAQKIFRFSNSKRRVLVHSGTDKTTFDRPGVSNFGQQPSRRGGGGGIAFLAFPWVRPCEMLLSGADLCGSEERCIRWGFRFPTGRGTFEGKIHVCRSIITYLYRRQMCLPSASAG